jgi:PGF-pre-PGF domain-containing protein
MKKILIVILLLIPLVYAQPVFPKEVVFFDKLVANQEQIKLIDNPEILFTKLGMTTNTNISRARITVQAMSDCPEIAPYQENVLQCFYINGFEFSDKQISKTEISFKVPKKWIEANSYNKIELRRYSYSWNRDGTLSTWKPSSIRLDGEDDENYLYTASSDGMYYFSIVGVKVEPVKEITASVVKENTEKTAKQELKFIPLNPKKESYLWVPVLVLTLITLLTFSIPQKETLFQELTDYVRFEDKPAHEIRNILKNKGWNEWQIDLAFREARKR